jgi:hypothetical protein
VVPNHSLDEIVELQMAIDPLKSNKVIVELVEVRPDERNRIDWWYVVVPLLVPLEVFLVESEMVQQQQ